MNWFYIVYVYLSCVSLPADVLWGSFVTHSFLPRYLFQAHLRGGGGGNLFERRGLFNLERTMVSVRLHKEVEYGVEELKYKKFWVMKPRISITSELSVGK